MLNEPLRVFRLSTAALDDEQFSEVRAQLNAEVSARHSESGSYRMFFTTLSDDELIDVLRWVESEWSHRIEDQRLTV